MNRRNLLIGIGAGLVVILLWYFALWAPRSNAIDQARERQQLAQQQQDDLRVRLARLKAAQRDEPAKRAQVEALRAAIPDEPSLAQFILDTNDAATRSGIDFLSIAPNQPGSGSPGVPANIDLTMSVSGGYFQVLDFLNRLNALPRLVVIRELSVGGYAVGGRLSVNLSASMFTAGGEAPPLGGSTPSGDQSSSTTSSIPGTTSTTAVVQ